MHISVSKNPQRLLLGVADRELRAIENFIKDQKQEKESGEGLMIVSAIICTFSMNFFASYSLFVFSRTCVRISGSSQSQSFISSSRFLPAADSEKYISRLSVFPIIREMSSFFSTAQIIFEVLEHVNPKASAISPDVKLLFSDSRQRSIPSLIFMP